MPSKSGENTVTLARFLASLNKWVEKSGLSKSAIARRAGHSPGNFTNILEGKRPISLAGMEEIASSIDKDLTDMLAEGRDILDGKAPEEANQAPPGKPDDKDMVIAAKDQTIAAQQKTIEHLEARLLEQEEGGSATSRAVATGALSRTAQGENMEKD